MKYYLLLVLCWLTFLLPYTPLWSQELYSIHLDNQNRLPTSAYYNIQQDAKGYIWMAGNEGLLRFDGLRYESFKSKLQTSTPGTDIKIDQQGRVWYQNFDGYIYYVQNDSLRGISQNPPVGYAPFGLTEQHLFVAQQKGIDIFDAVTLQLIKTIPLKIEEPEHATVKNGAYYYIADDVIYTITPQLALESNTFFKGKGMKVKLIFPYKDGFYVVSKNNETEQLYFLDAHLNYKNSIQIPQIKFIQASNVLDNQILLYSPNGLYAYNDFGVLQLDKMNILPHQSISSILKDYQNNLWIATTNNGVFIVPNMQNKVFDLQHYRPIKIIQRNNGYVVGTQTGDILLLDSVFKITKVINQNKENLPIYYLYHDPAASKTWLSAKGFSILSGPQLETEHNYNIALKQAVRIDQKYIAYAASGFCAIIEDPLPAANTSIWDHQYLVHKTKDLPNTARVLKGLRGKAVDYNSALQQIIYATNIGLFLVTPEKIFELKYQNKSFYAGQVLWIDNKLYALDTKGNLFKIENQENFTPINKLLGIPDFDIKKIKKYGNELLLLGSKYIYLYNTVSQQTEKTQIDIGINAVKDLLKVDDHLIVLTQNGILKLTLHQNKNNIPARFFINNISVNDVRKDSLSLLRLHYDETDVKIDYSLLDYGGNTTELYYRINQKEWTPIYSASGKLEFPALSPGTYTIEFKIGNQDTYHQLFLHIAQPFWKAWWFYLIIVFFIGAMAFIFFRRKSNVMKKEIQHLNEKVSLEKNLSKSVLTSIKSQMNPHFFYNALNTIQAYIFTNEKEKANTYLAKFSKLTRIILEMSEKDSISLNEELDSLKIYLDLEQMRFSDNFEYSIHLKHIEDKDSLEFPAMLIQPYVENAIKHGLLHRDGQRILTITFELEGSLLNIYIQDNGVGRQKSEAINKLKNDMHQSFATKANETRLEILNKRSDNKMGVTITDLFDENGLPSGTKVHLTIPTEK